MGKLISMSVVRARREGDFTYSEEDAARWRGYCAWKEANYFPDRACKPRSPASPPKVALGQRPPDRI